MDGGSRVPAATLASCVAPMSPAPQDSLRQMQLVPRQNLRFFWGVAAEEAAEGAEVPLGDFSLAGCQWRPAANLARPKSKSGNHEGRGGRLRNDGVNGG